MSKPIRYILEPHSHLAQTDGRTLINVTTLNWSEATTICGIMLNEYKRLYGKLHVDV